MSYNGPSVIKLTYLLREVAVDGRVATPGPIKGDTFDLIVDDQWLAITQAVPGRNGTWSNKIHCETYTEGIAYPPAVPSNAHVNHYEPWPLPPTPLPRKNPNDYFMKQTANGPQTLNNNDHVRVTGRLLIENAHQEQGSPWLELHPFDYTNIIDLSDSLKGEVTLAAVAPLYGDENYSGSPGNIDTNTMQLVNEVHASVPLKALLPMNEIIIENTTGLAPDAIRSWSYSKASGILSAHIRVQALPPVTADLFAQRSVFQAYYFAAGAL